MNAWKKIAAENRKRVVDFLRNHLGATYEEIARGTGLSVGAVRDHMKAIKQEWRDRCASQALTSKRGDVNQLMLFNLGEHEAAMRGSPAPCSNPTGSPDSKSCDPTS